MLEVPCEECISLAICYQKNDLNCKDLYEYICNVDHTKYLSFDGYKRGSGTHVTKTFNRYITNTNITGFKITLTKNKDLIGSNLLYEQ